MTSTIADADAAIDDELDQIELVQAAPNAEVVSAADTPCTAEEARALIRRAVNAANEFYSAIAELLSRQGHTALGYDSPRQMIARELSGMLVNPRTGKPVSDTHLRRMTRVAWLAWSIAQNTGIDMDQLQISERDVRSISAASAGPDDSDLIDDINARLAEVSTDAPDEVNDIIAESLSSFEQRKAAGEIGSRGSAGEPETSAGTSGQPQEQAPRASDEPDGAVGAGVDEHDQVPVQVDPAVSGDDKLPAAPAPKTPAASVASIFDTELPEGVEGTVSDTAIESALAHMRTAADVRRVMADITRIYQLLPTLTEIKDKVPHIVDAVDDDDLAALTEQIRSTDQAVDWAATARTVLAEALHEVDVRNEEIF